MVQEQYQCTFIHCICGIAPCKGPTSHYLRQLTRSEALYQAIDHIQNASKFSAKLRMANPQPFLGQY